MSSRLNGDKVAIVISAGGGIGHEITLTLADSGARVAIDDIGVSLQDEDGSASPAEETLGLIRQRDSEGLINIDSVTDWDSARRIVECTMDGFGRLDIVVNNAGVLCDAISHRMNADDWLLVTNVYLSGSFLVNRAATERFRVQQVGTFVHMTSTSRLTGNFGQISYSTVRSGIVVLSKFIVLGVQCYNVRSNCIAPFVWSRMIDSIPAEIPEQKAHIDKLQRMTPEKNAPLIVYLVLDAACGVTGQVFVARHHELFLMSQSRPLRGVHSERGWAPKSIARHGMSALHGSFMDLAHSPDVFSWDPI